MNRQWRAASENDFMDGVLVIDKPADVTSHDVVARVRKIIRERRVGHTGTLDPFATGVLVLLLGRATRLAQFLNGANKEYEAVIRFGYATDTGDITGTPLLQAEAQSPLRPSGEDIEMAVASLRGDIEQTPPMYSAKKIGGRRLYEFARRKEHVERKPVLVNVSTFEVIANDESACSLQVRVGCSAGTYIRVLAEDLGRRLGVGAHLAALRRTRAGSFNLADANTLEQLSELTQSDAIESVLISADAALGDFPGVDLDHDDVRRTLNGVDTILESTQAQPWTNGQPVRMRDANGQLIAVGIYNEIRRVIHPKVVIAESASESRLSERAPS